LLVLNIIGVSRGAFVLIFSSIIDIDTSNIVSILTVVNNDMQHLSRGATMRDKLCSFICGACIIGLLASGVLNWALYTGKLVIPNVDYITHLEGK